MAAKWNTAKSKLKDKELDAEFEKFLNESLSDESLASPRRSITPRGSNSKVKLESSSKPKFERPWWATSEDDDGSSMVDVVKKQWIKRKTSEDTFGDDGVDDVDVGIDIKQEENPLILSKDSIDVNSSRPGTALDTILSESEPSYTDTVKTPKVFEKASNADVDAEVDNKYTNDSFTEESDDQSSPSKASGKHTESTSNTPSHPGVDTLEEVKDKDLFFSKLEKETENVDYGMLNQEFHSGDEKIEQAKDNKDTTGADVLGLEPYRPLHYDDSSTDRNENDSDDEEKELSHSSFVGNSVVSKAETETNVPNAYSTTMDTTKENKQDIPSTLLSRVTLMESLDSTAGLNLAEKLSKLNAQLTTKESTLVNADQQHKQNRSAEQTSNEDPKLQTGDTTNEFAEALSNIRQLSTQSFGGPTDEKVDVVEDIGKTSRPIQSGDLLLDRDDQTHIKVSQFDLQPVISNFAEEPKIPAGPPNKSMDSTLAVTQSELNKVQTFSDMNDMIATALVDQYIQKEHEGHQQAVSPYANNFQQNDNNLAGFSLQPISNIVDSDQDSPPTDSLRSIKSIAEERKRKLMEKSKKAQRDIKSAPAKSRKTTKSNDNVRKRSSIPHTSKPKNPKAQSSLSFLTSRRSQEQPKSKPQKHSLQQNKSKEAPKRSNDLMESIESLTANLQEFRKDAERTDAILNSTLLEKSFSKEQAESHLHSLQREQNLQSELRKLHLHYDKALQSNEILHQQSKALQNDWLKMKKELAFDYEKKMKDLQEELFVLKNKLEMSENDRLIALDLKTKEFTELSKDDVEHLQKQLHQQESLLNGYQQENERLYKEVKENSLEKKNMEGRMFEQNQKLASEVGNLKEQLQNRPISDSLSSGAIFGAGKITQLQNQVNYYKTREEEHKQQILSLENEILLSKKKLRNAEKSHHSNSTEQELLKQLENMKSSHILELNKLNKKLTWYSENQELLDRDLSALKDNRGEIKELRSLVDRLEAENKKLKREKVLNQSEQNSNSTKVLDLKRQVKEMEEIIRRRHPNSLPALIFAASAVPGESKVYESIDVTQNRNVNAYLEKQVKSLEKELEEKDEENSRKVRAIEQQYNTMNLRYEEHVKQLEGKIIEITLWNKSTKSVGELEDDLLRQKEEFTTIIEGSKVKLKEKQNKLNLNELERDDLLEMKSSKTFPISAKKEVNRLKTQIKLKDVELGNLKLTLLVLQREREHLLQRSSENRELDELVSTRSRARFIDHATSPLVKVGAGDQPVLLERDNRSLRNTIEELQLETKETVLRYEAQEVQILNEKRKVEEQLMEKLKLTEDSCERQLEKQKMQFAVDHSNSKVAELNEKVKGTELMIEHLNQRLEESQDDRNRLTESKSLEEVLRKEIAQLQDELCEARKHFTPEMHHYKMLEAKIASMESRHVTRENELKNLAEKAQSKVAVELNYAEHKWRDILHDKDKEISHFREELDAIIEVLRELKRQGIILPISDVHALE